MRDLDYRPAVLLLSLLLPVWLPAAPAAAQAEPRTQTPQLRPDAGAMAAESREIPPPEDLTEPPEDAVHTDTGLVYRVLRPGPGGEPATRSDLVTVHYTVWTDTGATLDTTRAKNKPRVLMVARAIEGFQQAVTEMVVGESRRCWIPPSLAYEGVPGKPQGPLVFDIELVSIRRGPPPPPQLDPIPEDAVRSESGLVYKVLREGEPGESPGPEDMVFVDYRTWSPEGNLLDENYFEGEPAAFSMELAIPGLREAFARMTPGEHRLLWIPPELTMLEGETGSEETVIFDVEMLSFIQKPKTPADVAAPPDDAQTSPLGVHYRVLREGSGERQPDYDDTVVVHYAGWTTDGEMFDASYRYGKPGRFRLDSRMPIGWVDVVRGMRVGERRLVWVPAELAYDGQADRPQGMLVFDIDLVGIE